MRATDHGDVVAQRRGVEARVLAGRSAVADAIALLDRLEGEVQAPLVDESERARLQTLGADGTGTADTAHWHSLVAQREERGAGYAGVVVPPEPDGTATADVAVDRAAEPCGPVLAALLSAAGTLSRRHGASALEVWLRHARDDDVACAADEGFVVARRLAVLGRTLDGVSAGAVQDDVVVRAYRPDRDAGAVVALLAAAYADTSDAGWDHATFAQRRSYAWFDPRDLLLADSLAGDGLLGLHWTKRRSQRVGEVYNLAVHPSAQGRGIGAVLLDAGLTHLQAAGCDEVLLWVDRANVAAVRLYRSRGFERRWEDIALTRRLAD